MLTIANAMVLGVIGLFVLTVLIAFIKAVQEHEQRKRDRAEQYAAFGLPRYTVFPEDIILWAF